jgi:Tol biopolymer transport system component
MNPDGTGLSLVTGAWNSATPTWSPDRRKLAFVHLNGPTIYLANRTGAHVTLFNSGENPSWSPDGTQIAYDYQLGGNRDVMTGSADGPGVLRLTNDPADDEDPTWSPDGTKIAFVSNRTGTREIFVTDANGLVETQVTSCGAQGLSCSSPAWSPVAGDDRILFAAAGAANGIYTIKSNGAGLTPVRLFVGSLATEPVWSPDGTQIAFTRYMPATAADIYRMNADGTGLIQLTTDPRDDVSPAWSR